MRTTNLRISAVLAAVFAVVVAVLALMAGAGAREEAAPAAATGAAGSGGAGAAEVVRPDSHRLSDPADSDVTFVEFLDFECEACRAAFPAVEQLRAEYGDRVTFVVRYFPIPSHRNAENAAIAVEAAAQQGRFEAMYQRMYETQTEWGEQQDSRAALFREFAADLGLDLDAYDRAVADPATLERVLRDRDDGTALGVQGTPTFFVNGERVEARSYEDLTGALDAALAG